MREYKCGCVQLPFQHYIMRTKGLGREFMELSKYDLLTVAVLRLRDRLTAKRVVDRIDALAPEFTDVFFMFETLDCLERGLNEDSPSEHHLVMAYHPDGEKFNKLLKRIERGALVKNETVSVLGLYVKMANCSFRAQNCLFFDRLKVEDAVLCKAMNPLSRVFFIERDVLTLKGIALEEQVMVKMSAYCKKYRQREGGGRGSLSLKKQRALQRYLYGQFSPHVIIHLPKKDAEPIFQMLSPSFEGKASSQEEKEEKEEKEDTEMRDCIDVSYQMDFETEGHELSVLMEGLYVAH